MIFEKLNKRNARAFFDLYMSRKDQAIDALRQQSEASGGPSAKQLDFSAESLVPLWGWARDKMPAANEHPALDQMPPWYAFEFINHKHGRSICLTKTAAELIDKLAYYWGETLLRYVPETKWDIEPFPQSYNYCKPVIRSEFSGSYPLGFMIIRAAIYHDSASDARVSDDSLLGALKYIQKEEIEYRSYIANGGEGDPRMKKRMNFE